MTAAYLKLGDLNGESTDARYRGWIPLESFSLGQSLGAAPGGGGGSGQTSVKSNDIFVTKLSDRTTADIMKASTKGRHFDHAIICIMGMPEGSVGSAFLMEDVLITGMQFSGGGGGESKPLETLSLNFRKMTPGTIADYSAPYGPASPGIRKKQAAAGGRPTGAPQAKRPGK